MSAAEKALSALEAVNESRAQHLLALHLSSPIAAVARAAMARRSVRMQFNPTALPYQRRQHHLDAVKADVKLDAALDEIESAAEGVTS